ncbi:MAG: tetratricopeptide repeat protein, partial [Deltaproteobacteria bacterium]
DAGRDVLWASTRDAGLLKLQPTADSLRLLRQFAYDAHAAAGLRVNYVWPLLLGKGGDLWIGTIGGGLHQLSTDAQGRDVVRPYGRYLPESDVESLLADEAGHLWVGGTGLYRFTPASRRYLRYDVADGLQSNAFKIGAAARGADGTLYFGGINGINYFQPWAIQANPSPPVVQFTGLRVVNQPVAVGRPFNGRVLLPQPLSRPQTVTIRAAENDFSVEFVALNYTNPQKNHYAYRLLGYNEGWVRPGPGQRTASFANLPPGRYTLEVKADNGEGVWSPRPATMQFEVLAPWYKTWWAYLLYASAMLGAIALYRQIPKEDSNYIYGLYEQALSLHMDSQFVASIQRCEEGLRLKADRSREPDLYTQLAISIDNNGDKQRALRVFDSGLAKYPGHLPLMINKAITLSQLKQWDAAISVYQRALLINPYHASAHLRLAQCAVQKGRLVEAYLGFVSYLMINPSGPHHKTAINGLSQIANVSEDVTRYIVSSGTNGEPGNGTGSAAGNSTFNSAGNGTGSEAANGATANASFASVNTSSNSAASPNGQSGTWNNGSQPDNFKEVQEIVLSKIALNANYKPLVKLNDVVCRQLQVICEK